VKEVLDYHVADDWEEYGNSQYLSHLSHGVGIGAVVLRWWRCPHCHQEFAFEFTPAGFWPPLTLPCPGCKCESEIPWPTPLMVTWTCERCGRVFSTSRYTWASQSKTYTRVRWREDGIHAGCDTLCCPVCSLRVGESLSLSDHVSRFFGSGFFGPPEDFWASIKANIESAEKAFDEFFQRVPALTVEQARLAEMERQRLLAEEEKRKTVAGLKSIDPTDFESAVASLYQALGYNVHLTPGSGDQGIDIVLTKDEERIAVQCKRYGRVVPISHVREFYGSFMGEFSRGIFVTSATFSRNTYEWAEQRNELELLNGEQLAQLFAEHKPEIVRDFDRVELPGLSRKSSRKNSRPFPSWWSEYPLSDERE